MESTELYLNYANWSIQQHKQTVNKSVFGKILSKLGYSTYRENVPGNYGGKKCTFVENVTLSVGQGKHENGQGKKNSLSNSPDSEKPEIGQATFSFVDIATAKKEELTKVLVTEEHHNTQITDSETCKNEEKMKKYLTRKEFACPNPQFFDSGTIGQAKMAFSGFACPTQQKLTNHEEINSPEFLRMLNFLKTEIKTFQSSWVNQHGSVGDIEVFCDALTRKYPGYLQNFTREVILEEAGKICKKIPGEFSNN